MGKSKEPGLMAYNVVSKEKEEMKDVTINRNGNRCMAHGFGVETGQKMCATIGLENAKTAVREGNASKGEGWE